MYHRTEASEVWAQRQVDPGKVVVLDDCLPFSRHRGEAGRHALILQQGFQNRDSDICGQTLPRKPAGYCRRCY